MLSEKNVTLDNGDIWGLDTPLKDFVPGFKMYADNATQLATTNDFLGTSFISFVLLSSLIDSPPNRSPPS
jgi:hypothetical protein